MLIASDTVRCRSCRWNFPVAMARWVMSLPAERRRLLCVELPRFRVKCNCMYAMVLSYYASFMSGTLREGLAVHIIKNTTEINAHQ